MPSPAQSEWVAEELRRAAATATSRQLTGREQQPGDTGVDGGQQRDGDAGLGLALAAREHDAADDEQTRRSRPRHAAQHALALQEQRQGAEAEQDAAGTQRRTPSGRRLPTA